MLVKYDELKLNNEEFQNLVVKELDQLNRQLALKRTKSGREVNRKSRKDTIENELKEESLREQVKGQAATEEMFKNVFNSLRNYLMPAGEPRRNYG